MCPHPFTPEEAVKLCESSPIWVDELVKIASVRWQRYWGECWGCPELFCQQALPFLLLTACVIYLCIFMSTKLFIFALNNLKKKNSVFTVWKNGCVCSSSFVPMAQDCRSQVCCADWLIINTSAVVTELRNHRFLESKNSIKWIESRVGVERPPALSISTFHSTLPVKIQILISK